MASKVVVPSEQVKNGLLPTPPMPDGLPQADLTDNARKVLMKRYVRRGNDGKPAETVEEMFWRVAYHVAKVEEQWQEDVEKRTIEYYHLLSSKKFFPNSPTFTGAGTPLGQLAACFVLPITDDMGRDSAGIFQTLRDAALIQQTGGGNGFSFSRLRPKGALVQTSAGQATGPVGFLRVYDHAFGEIAQGGCLLPDTLVFTNHGLLRLDEIVNSDVLGWQEHALSVPTDEGVKASLRGYNNGVADVLRVHTRQGLSITGTPNHKVKVMTDDGPHWKEIQHLTRGDWILLRLGEHIGKLQALRKPSQKHGNQVMPQLPAILDEELAFLLGYLAGDGFVAQAENDHRVGCSVAHTSYLMEEMPILLERLFNIKVHKMQKPNDASATFVMDNRAIKEFLLMNGLGKRTSRDVSVPRLIRQSPPQIVGAYLRGLFEADGTLIHGYPSLVTSSRQLARDVSTLLIGLGCPVGIRTTMAGLDRWGDSESYQVRITSTVGLQAWRKKIGCDPRSRFVVAYAWESDQRRESSYILPNPKYWLQPVLETITLEQIDAKGRGRNINFRATEPNLRRQILRYYHEDRNLTRSGYELLKATHPIAFENVPPVEGFWFVEVSGVEAAGQSLTLDLEVADNHTYLAYGMVTHNTRRGANMAVLRVDHPDVEDFITSKTNENHITNFNISVGITDAFMRAVKEDKDWELRFPDVVAMKSHKFSGTLEQAEKKGIKINSYQKVKARDLFNKIVKQAHHNGEPGVLFLDAANRGNPVPHLYPLEATNPCGEQWLGPYENCCLGSVNLNEHCGPDGTVDWELLRQSVVTATRFLDDVVEANAYVPAVPQLTEAAHRARRIGLGIMGLADLMYHAGVRYGSKEGQEFGAQVMEFVRYHAMKTSIELAEARGPFPAIEGSIYDMDNMTWMPPQTLIPFENDWGRPEVQWEPLVDDLKKHGIRNAAQTTVAPTGTIATVAGCEGYGCEPVFALAYIRHVNDNGKDLTLTYTSPRFDEALKEMGLGEEKRQEIVEQVMREGTCQHITDIPQAVRDTFVVSGDITAEEHVRMQAALQAFVDNSLSKTVNFPENATEQDVATAYLLAWELGCKGITVYVTGSRDKVVLETKATAEKKEAPASTAPQPKPELATTFTADPKKPRPRALTGKTFSVETPVGKAFITINENGGEQPFEAFINTAKAGSETAAVSEAIGRLISYILRMASPTRQTDRLREIVRQLSGIGGGRSLGLGPNRVRSLPDGIGQVLELYLREKSGALPAVEEKSNGGSGHKIEEEMEAASLKVKIGDLCPECGEAAVVNEEGCRKCYACGFSEC
ncbi:MAG TPA: adenosylcobalamin-dependent ribonucleoside-diphosphate reductase [Anaerolineales bacterium]|nr:adenosylcobalamin-dependent ribonucleoside-diphosphate reductase [Anaerolineales bacterium]